MKKLGTTIAAYNKYAKVYDDEVIDFWGSFPKSIVRGFTEKLPGKKVLDLGSGSGRDALLLRDAGLAVICLDASEAMAEMTRKLGFETRLVDFSELNSPPESFDGVWAYTSLIHVPPDQAKQTIEKIRETLKSGGLFMIGVIEGDFAGMVEYGSMPTHPRYFKLYNSTELKQLISPLGFTLLYEEDYKPRRKYNFLNQIYRVEK